jgi:hypothetical protein
LGDTITISSNISIDTIEAKTINECGHAIDSKQFKTPESEREHVRTILEASALGFRLITAGAEVKPDIAHIANGHVKWSLSPKTPGILTGFLVTEPTLTPEQFVAKFGHIDFEIVDSEESAFSIRVSKNFFTLENVTSWICLFSWPIAYPARYLGAH